MQCAATYACCCSDDELQRETSGVQLSGRFRCWFGVCRYKGICWQKTNMLHKNQDTSLAQLDMEWACVFLAVRCMHAYNILCGQCWLNFPPENIVVVMVLPQAYIHSAHCVCVCLRLICRIIATAIKA